MRLKLFYLLIIVMLLPGLAIAEVMTVSFSGAEMRSAPNAMGSKVVTEVSVNTPLTVLEKKAEYFKVRDFRGRTGWVHRALLSSSPGVVIKGDRANVRQGPGVTHPVVFQLSKGATCRVLSEQDGWIEIRDVDGRTGWIAKFLTWGH
jgi:SH3-like domain-containing protein